MTAAASLMALVIVTLSASNPLGIASTKPSIFALSACLRVFAALASTDNASSSDTTPNARR